MVETVDYYEPFALTGLALLHAGNAGASSG